MKKSILMFQKKEGLLRPAHFVEFEKIQEQVDELGWCQAEFGKPSKAKSNPQLGYLYSAVYPHFVAHYTETQGYVFQIQKGNELIDIEANTESVDLFLKTLFCIHKTIKLFKKEKASIEDMKEYIDFLDKLSINNFGECLPEPKQIKESK
jgi:hypothetical protein